MMIALIRFGIFAIVLIGFAVIEQRFPKRRWRTGWRERWRAHGALGGIAAVIPALLTRVVPVAGGVGAAAWAARAQVGLINWIGLSGALAVLLAVLMLDLAIYAQHRAMHRWRPLWRLHAVHHHDHDLDVTTALRFHPAEILVSTLYKSAAAALIGAPIVAVVIHETLLSAMAIFNHANIALPPRVERWVRPVLVTPTMHARHHSIVRGEHDANYGNVLSLWDRLFGSYCPEPDYAGPFAIGLAETQHQPVTGLRWQLLLPWR